MNRAHIRTTRRGYSRIAGFTILELVVVMVVISIVAAIALPKIDIGRYRSDGRVQIVRKALQQAQRSSLVRQHDVIVSFDTTTGRIRVALDADNNGSIASAEIITWQSLSDGGRFAIPPSSVNGGAAPSLPIAAVTLKSVTSMPTVVFHRDGSVSSDVTIYFSSLAGPQTDFRAVTVSQGTGRTDWYRYIGSAWKPGAL